MPTLSDSRSERIYQTHPDFLARFVDDPKVHVVLQPSGIFHPKIYLFENSSDDWVCVIGSPNFTGAALSLNAEVAVQFDSEASVPKMNYDVLHSVIDEHWGRGEPLTKELLEPYRAIWNRKRQLLGQLAGTYGGKGGTPIVSVALLTLGWPEFVSRVRSEKNHALSERIDV